MFISSNLFFNSIVFVIPFEITKVFKSKKIFFEILTFCPEWEAPGAIVIYLVSPNEQIKLKPTVICVIESRKRTTEKRDFVTRRNNNLEYRLVPHTYVCVCSAVLERRRIGASANASLGLRWKNQLELWSVRISASSWHGESVTRERWKGSQKAQRQVRALHRTNRFRSAGGERKQTSE